MALIDDIVRQQTEGKTDPLAFGIPTGWDWHDGSYQSGYDPAAGGVTAVTGYLHSFPLKVNGAMAPQPDYSAIIETRNFITWVRNKATKAWSIVQPATLGMAGGNFPFQFLPGGSGATPINRGNGVIGFKTAPAGHLLHWWPAARGTFTAGTVDAAYMQAEVRITNPAHKTVIGSGIDWWKDASVGYVAPPGTNNPAGSIAGWDLLTDQWKIVGSYSCTHAVLRANPPPPLVGGGVVTPPAEPPVPPVFVGFTGAVNWTFENGVLKKVELK